jgi:carbamoyl-phosphate synthase large subunit
LKYSTILVTGCGGDIGSGIGKLLRMSEVADKIIGCDVHNEHPGATIFDRCFIVPNVNSTEYMRQIEQLIRDEAVELIIPASEIELRYFLQNNLNGKLGNVPFINASLEAMKLGFDKLATASYLEACGLPYPWTKIVSEGPPPQIPCIIKSREGAGSKDVRVVEPELVEYYQKKRPDDIWQEYLTPDDQEYTCGLYRTRKDEIRSIIIRRKLQGGFTVYGEIIYDNEIERVLHKLAHALKLRGSINVQLRLTVKGPVIFEINPRFSSTIVFRHLLGFKDVLWSLIEHKGYELEAYEPPAEGTKFYRGSHEIILPIELGGDI